MLHVSVQWISSHSMRIIRCTKGKLQQGGGGGGETDEASGWEARSSVSDPDYPPTLLKRLAFAMIIIVTISNTNYSIFILILMSSDHSISRSLSSSSPREAMYLEVGCWHPIKRWFQACLDLAGFWCSNALLLIVGESPSLDSAFTKRGNDLLFRLLTVVSFFWLLRNALRLSCH